MDFRYRAFQCDPCPETAIYSVKEFICRKSKFLFK